MTSNPLDESMESLTVVPPAASPASRILVVEDEAVIRDMVALVLQQEGFTVDVAADGRTALNYFRSDSPEAGSVTENPDLVVLDLMLPAVNGLDFCQLLRRQGVTVPILMLSAKDTETDRVVGLEIGADDYLTKPFGTRELVARCRALLRRSQNQPAETPAVLRYEGLKLFPEECRVLLDDRELTLSPKEFRLLELFMRHPRRVWSRDQLLEKIWGIDFMGDSKTIDVHIRWLREKIEANPSNPSYLLTVRGFGYRLG
ncbi:response regulator transcription factor [Synechococcus elongatus]|uniref:response regulator transcription factor n=1 Tax=Synechococcus elongatus TaxID=32046 RepID=UPI000F7F6132|nr:response regulator transcription factor [Synechococcus elongatus]